MLPRLFSRRWLLATALVLVAAAVLARLGFWQLDRLEWRRSLNARVTEQQAADPLALTRESLESDLYSMEYRRVTVTGVYLTRDEIVLRNQVWQGEFGTQMGVKLFTPLFIEGTESAILVERGWIPDAEDRAAYIVEDPVTVSGQLRRAETDFALSASLHPDPTLTPDQERLEVWNNLDLQRLASQMEKDLLPVYLQIVPGGTQTEPPYALPPQLDLSEGPHLGYAFQWFAFAALLLIGYPIYVQRQESKKDAGIQSS